MTMTTGSARAGGQRLLLVAAVLAGLVSVLVGAWALYATAVSPNGSPRVVAAIVPGTAGDGGVAGVNPEAVGVNTGAVDQASGVRMRVEKPGTIPQDEIGSGPTGGCVLGYGRGHACLPTVPPGLQEHAGHGGAVADLAARWTCSAVQALFPNGIPVNAVADGVGPDGVDPLRLDSNGDQLACGPGDRG